MSFNNEESASNVPEIDSSEDFYSSLASLTLDPSFNGNLSTLSLKNSKQESELDVTRVTDRILAMGMCWRNRTEKKSCRNNTTELSKFLNASFGRNYMIWNLSPPSQSTYDTLLFNNQVVRFSFSKSLSLTIKNIFDVCKSMCAWAALDARNIIVVQCQNGKSRTGLIIACFLRFCNLFDSAHDAFEHFVERRCPKDRSWISVTITRYLRYFNDICYLEGLLPNPKHLQLHQIIVNTVPDFDGNGSCNPALEVYQNGILVYSSLLANTDYAECSQSSDNEDGLNAEDTVKKSMGMTQKPAKAVGVYESLVLLDKNHMVFKLRNLIMEKDVQIKLLHLNEEPKKSVTILSLSFNTGFLAAGVIRLQKSDVELPFVGNDSADSRFHQDFALDLVVTEAEKETNSLAYDLSQDTQFAKNFIKLSQYHSVRPDAQLLQPLELQGHRKIIGILYLIQAALALQITNNDLHLAHEFLVGFAASNLHKIIEAEFVLLGKKKFLLLQEHEKAKAVKLSKSPSTSALMAQVRNAAGSVKFLRGESNQELNSSQVEENKNSHHVVEPVPLFSVPMEHEEKTSNMTANNPPLTVVSSGQIPPPPPPPPPSALFASSKGPPPPPPLLGSVDLIANGSQSKIIAKAALHWNEISRPNDIQNTVWSELNLSDETKVSLDIHKFEELFCFNPSSPDLKSKNSTARLETKGKVRLLDLRRSNNISIGISRFYKRFGVLELLDAVIERCSLLSADDLLTLMPLLPTEEEKQLIGVYKGKVEDLDKAEYFIYTMSKEPHLKWMCNALLFECQFEGECRMLMEQLEDFSRIFGCLRNNEKLKLLLKLVLEIGNLTNYEYSRPTSSTRMRGKALGFKLDSLIKLQDVRGVDKSVNLMNYLAMISEENDPAIAKIFDELKGIENLKFIESESLLEGVSKLSKGLDSLKNENLVSKTESKIEQFRLSQESFLNNAESLLVDLQCMTLKFNEAWDATAQYFGENPKERKPEELLLLLDQFLKNLKFAFNQNKQKSPKKNSRENMKLNMQQLKTEDGSPSESKKSPVEVNDSEDLQSERSTLRMVESRLSLSLSFDSESPRNL